MNLIWIGAIADLSIPELAVILQQHAMITTAVPYLIGARWHMKCADDAKIVHRFYLFSILWSAYLSAAAFSVKIASEVEEQRVLLIVWHLSHNKIASKTYHHHVVIYC